MWCRCNQAAAGFQLYRLVNDVAWDLRAFVGYAPVLGAKVVAFRGTDSHSWYTAYPPSTSPPSLGACTCSCEIAIPRGAHCTTAACRPGVYMHMYNRFAFVQGKHFSTFTAPVAEMNTCYSSRFHPWAPAQLVWARKRRWQGGQICIAQRHVHLALNATTSCKYVVNEI